MDDSGSLYSTSRNKGYLIMHLPNGAQIFVETSRGEEIEAPASTNAENPVATVASKGNLVKGDYVIVTKSRWAKMVSRVLIVTDAQETSITLSGIDTSDTLVFPAGGTMSFVKIT